MTASVSRQKCLQKGLKKQNKKMTCVKVNTGEVNFCLALLACAYSDALSAVYKHLYIPRKDIVSCELRWQGLEGNGHLFI